MQSTLTERRTWGGRWVLACGALALTALLALANGASVSAREPRTGPPPLVAEANGKAVPGITGSYCWHGPEATLCADSVYPVPTPRRLTASSRDRVSLRLSAPLTSVTATLGRVSGEEYESLSRLRVRPIPASSDDWSTRLPKNLQRANVLRVRVGYPESNGGIEYWVGLRAKPRAG